MMRTLTYAGKDFSEFSCWWDGSQVFEKPAKIAQNYQIPFRNGDFIRSTEAFENVQIRFNCFIKDNYEENYSELVNFLNSFDTYQRLETSAEPSIYRMAFLHAVIEPETGQFLKDGQFTIVFDCMPQEWLKSGEEEFSIDMQTNSYTGNPVTYENEFGDSVVDSLTVEFEPQQDLNGYEYPWAGGAGKNKVDCAMLATVTSKGVTMYSDQYGRVYLNGTATGDGSFTLATNIVLPSGSYYLNGLADGAGMDSFYYTMSSGGAIIAYLSNDETQLNGGTYSLYLNFVSGQVFNNTVFAPMIREVGTEPYFEPYENICPITGYTTAMVQRTGKNLCAGVAPSERTANGITYTFVDDGETETNHITITGTSTANNADSGNKIIGGADARPITLKANTTYSAVLYGVDTMPVMRLFLRDSNGTNLWYGDSTTGIWTFTPSEDITVSRYQLRVRNNGSVMDVDAYFQIEEGSEATAYEPYQGQTYTTSLGQTVYGGSLDLVSGVLTIDRKLVNASEKTWSWGGGAYVYANFADTDMTQKAEVLSNMFPCWTGTGTRNGYISWGGSPNNGNMIVRSPEIAPSLAEWNTFIQNNDVQLLYYLAEPQTIQLTPQQISMLQGTNIFSSDISDITVTITEGTTLNNPSYMKARPLIILNGSGTGSVMLNGEEVVRIDVTPSNVPLYIDCETMDCYSIVNGETVNENRHVTLPEGYIELQKGDNRFTASGDLQPSMIPRWWRL